MGRRAVSTVKLSAEGLNSFADMLNEFASRLDSATYDALDDATEAGADMMRKSLASATDGYGTIDGNDPGTIRTVNEYIFGGTADIRWSGEQVQYIEFGYGAMGAADPYPGVIPVPYAPDPTKEKWDYYSPATNSVRTSYSLGSLAPLYLTGQQLIHGRRTLSKFLSARYDKIYPRGVHK